jgi:ribonucleotide monophosphatase NagD (HAD superfamily)
MLGINVPEETVYGSSYVTAHYVKDYHPEIKEIYAFGMNGIIEEFKNVGINVSPLHSGKADAVIAGMDLSLTYEKICYTYKLLHVII